MITRRQFWATLLAAPLAAVLYTRNRSQVVDGQWYYVSRIRRNGKVEWYVDGSGNDRHLFLNSEKGSK